MKRFMFVPPATVLPGQVMQTLGDKYKLMEGNICLKEGQIVEVHQDLMNKSEDELILMVQKFRAQLRQMTNIQMLLRAWQRSRSYWIHYSMQQGEKVICDLAEYNSIEGAHSKVDALKDEAKMHGAELHYAIIEGIEREDDDGPYSPQGNRDNIVESGPSGGSPCESQDDVFTSGVPIDPK